MKSSLPLLKKKNKAKPLPRAFSWACWKLEQLDTGNRVSFSDPIASFLFGVASRELFITWLRAVFQEPILHLNTIKDGKEDKVSLKFSIQKKKVLQFNKCVFNWKYLNYSISLIGQRTLPREKDIQLSKAE